MLDVPFYANTAKDGSQCYQVSMQSALRYFLGKEFSVEYLDEITHRKEGLWTSTSQIVSPLYNLGLNLRYFCKNDIRPSLGGEAYIRKQFGPNAEKILSHIDVDVMVESVKNLLNYDIFEIRTLTLEEIEQNIRNNCVQLVLVDWFKITKKEGAYQGHMVVLTGFDDDSIYFHNSGPAMAQANMKVKKEVFMEAWNANGTENDVVVIYGKR